MAHKCNQEWKMMRNCRVKRINGRVGYERACHSQEVLTKWALKAFLMHVHMHTPLTHVVTIIVRVSGKQCLR